jgi:hypothetical protein
MAIVLQHHVLQIDVPMNDPEAMKVIDRACLQIPYQ